jgi:hypothetical protein
MLSECDIPPAQSLVDLNQAQSDKYGYKKQIGCRIRHIFSRFASNCIPPLSETDRLTIRRFQRPGVLNNLLTITHFPPKRHRPQESQAPRCQLVARKVRETKGEGGHAVKYPSVMSPFEPGLASSAGLLGLMTRSLPQTGSRDVHGDDYRFFQNSLWLFLGDAAGRRLSLKGGSNEKFFPEYVRRSPHPPRTIGPVHYQGPSGMGIRWTK